MHVYILKKILLLFPAMFLLAVVVFFLSEMAPGDRVLSYLDIKGSSGISQKDDIPEKDYMEIAEFLHLDLPSFYFSIHPAAVPGDIYKLVRKNKKNLAKSLYLKSGNRNIVSVFLQELDSLTGFFDKQAVQYKGENSLSGLQDVVDEMKKAASFKSLKKQISDLNAFLSKNENALPPELKGLVKKVIRDFEVVERSQPDIFGFLPVISWYGTANRFHLWFAGVLRLDFGISAVDGRSISEKIRDALRWTLLYMVVAYILTFGLALALGFYGAYRHGGRMTKILDVLFAAFYSIPLFWLATLAVIFLASGELTGGWHIFPPPGIGQVEHTMNWLRQIRVALPHLILPSLVVALHSGAYLSSLLKKSMLEEMQKKYYLAFLAKGLDKGTVIKRHILPNALMPLVTVFIVGFPASLGGSVVTEVIFNIPGMGRLFYDSILAYDWYVVYAIVLLIGVATYFSYIAGDIIYAYLNPKIKFA